MFSRNNLLKLAALIVFMVLVFYGVNSILEQRAFIQTRQAEAETAFWKGQAEVRSAENAKMKVALQAAKDQADASAKDAEAARKAARAAPIPKKPGPAPEANPDLAQQLVDMGWKPGLVVYSDPFVKSGVAHSDAQLTWTWGKENARIPALELRIQKDDEAMAADSKALEDCQKAGSQAELLAQGKDAQLAAEAKRREAVEAVASGLTKQMKASERKWYIKAGAAVFVAYLAGKKL